MSKTQRLSIDCSKKIVSVVCIFGLTFSVTGCFLLGKVKSHKNYEAMLASVAEGNLVEEWTGDIPEGMEVQYALTKKQSVGESDHLYEFLYEYDDQGRIISYKECDDSGYILYEKAYDENGNIISKRQTHKGYTGSGGFPDIEFEYKYNDDGQLIYYKQTNLYNNDVYEHFLEYDEDGYLISCSNYNDSKIFEVNFETAPYFETVAVVSDDKEANEPVFITRFYNAEGLLLSEQTDKYTDTYEYDNGEVIRRTREFPGTSLSYTYDANGNGICHGKGNDDNYEVTEYQYNEHNDLILKEVTRGDDVIARNTYSYEYDKNGNIISKTDEFYHKSDNGKESTVVDIYTYTYDEHNLPLTEGKRYDDGTFLYLNVYYYKAILVPVS